MIGIEHITLLGHGLLIATVLGMASTRVPLNTSIDKDLAVVLRLLARLKYGDKKGSISEVVEEALAAWCKENKDLIDEDKAWIDNFFGEDIEQTLKKSLDKNR